MSVDFFFSVTFFVTLRDTDVFFCVSIDDSLFVDNFCPLFFCLTPSAISNVGICESSNLSFKLLSDC